MKLLLALLAGCSPPFAFDTPNVVALAPENFNDTWTTLVKRDVADWNAHLTNVGCEPPFIYGGEFPNPVALVPESEWRYPGAVGFETSRGIVIRERLGGIRDDGTVLHELGHAIGLEEGDPADGPSIMLSVGTIIQPRDVKAAACVLGCGPC